MTPRAFEKAGRLARATGGNVTMLFAGALTMLVGTAALGVDVGTLYLERRRLQGVADAAALAAAADPSRATAAVDALVAAGRGTGARVESVVVGTYAPDASQRPGDRFRGGTPGNAVRVSLSIDVPAYFSRILTGETTTRIGARATAARIDLAAFSIGSRLAAVDGGLPNALLSGLLGTQVSLSVSDYDALVAGRVDVLKFSEALRGELGLDAATFAETLAARVTLPQALTAMAAASDSPSAAAALKSLSGKVPPLSVSLDRMIDLGSLGQNVRADPRRAIPVPGYAMLRAAAELASPTRQVAADVALGLPGLASAKLTVQVGERPAHSPWLAVGAAGQVTIRTAQTRILIDATLAGGVPGLGPVRVPIFVELASAEATLTALSCAEGRDRATATLGVTPSLGRVAIADVDSATFADFNNPPALASARIASAPGIVVTGLADIALGGATAQSVSFDADDIANQRAKTVSTNDIVTGVATSLIDRVALKASVGGLGIGGGLVTSAVGTLLASVAGPLDQLIAGVTGLSGVRVGQADVWVNGVRCGTPVLVA